MTRLLPAGRMLVVFDLLLAIWAAFWIAVGLAVADEMQGLTDLTGTVRETGLAIRQTGDTLGDVGGIPLIGGAVEEQARQIQRAGDSAVASARSSRESIENLSFLLGLAIAVIPSVPLLGFYLPLRISRERESRALARVLRSGRADAAFEDFLADRALQTLPYRRLNAIAGDPWHRDRAARRALACAELERLGVDPAPLRRAAGG